MVKKLRNFIVIILSIILVYRIIDIAAAYITMSQAEGNAKVEPWKILINGEEITTTEIKTFDIEDYIQEKKEVRKGKFAPNMSCSIPIEIDASNLKNINVKYDIKIKNIELIPVNIKIKEVIETNAGKELEKIDEKTYTGKINIKELTKHNLNINIIWENNEENNEIDTEYGTKEEQQKISIPIEVIVTQYIEE